MTSVGEEHVGPEPVKNLVSLPGRAQEVSPPETFKGSTMP
jgi:hypothetical protein